MLDARTPVHEGLDLIADARVLPSRFGRVTRHDLVARSASGAVEVTDLPTVDLHLDGTDWVVHWFTSDWGDEFTPQQQPVGEPLRLEVRTGRSSKGMHPWACLERPGAAVVVSPAWSGNWRIDIEVDPSGVTVKAGISPWRFSRLVTPGRPFEAPAVYVAEASTRADAGAALADAAGRWVTPRTPVLPATWNHWWPYEDAEISHDVFVANARVARDLGLDLADLDAGWFGAADPDTFWEKVRGDWDTENLARFPRGTAGLADEIRGLGVSFGVWCEIEALGVDAAAAREHPEIVALGPLGADAEAVGQLGYVCLGSPAGWTHARAMLERLLTRTQARWVKIDFNLDPGSGCSRTDHGHGAGDGLYEHYRGLYALLADVRRAHPTLTVEACSSGGLRLDLGLAEQVHCSFMSDPDWTEFHLQLLWGACQQFPAAALYHFSESQWRCFHPLQNLQPDIDPVDYTASLHAVALHRWAVSQKLVDLPTALRERLADHVRVTADEVAPLLRDGAVIRPLTGQTLREGRGERWPAFQLDAGDRHVIASVWLPGASESTLLRPVGLEPNRSYGVRLLGAHADPGEIDLPDGPRTGAELTAGLRVTRRDNKSWLLAIAEVTS